VRKSRGNHARWLQRTELQPGVADNCPMAATLCQQTEIGPGFCDGTCTAPASAPAPALTPAALLIGLVLLGGFGAFDLRRRVRNRRLRQPATPS